MTSVDGSADLARFLDAVAARTPTPGGGAVAAAAGALASAMARMVAAYSTGPKTDPAVAKDVNAIGNVLQDTDHTLRSLIDEDARAYADLTEKTKLARSDPAAVPTRDNAIRVAAAVPRQIAGLATDGLCLMQQLLRHANSNLLSDLAVAAALAEGAVAAAATMVRVNADHLPDDAERSAMLEEIDRLTGEAGRLRGKITSAVYERLQQQRRRDDIHR